MDLLNANSYEKGGWVLHMLRQEVGDTVFKNIIRTYYNRYRFSNADTWAFEKVAEEVSGNNLKPFFHQWLFAPGVPQLNITWKWAKDLLYITVHQKGKQRYSLPLTIGVYTSQNNSVEHRFNITQATETFTLPIKIKPVKVVLDPDTHLLFEGTFSEKK
jgi:aminopeptidase N